MLYLVVSPPELLKGYPRMQDGQCVDPDSPTAEFEAKSVVEEAAQNLHHSGRRVAVLPIHREEGGQTDDPILPHRHLEDRSRR